jgi:hypothetical protein
MNNIKQTAAKLAEYGRNGDTMLAHITPQEAGLLKGLGGSGTINPKTGLPEYFLGSVVGGLLGGIGGVISGSKASDAAAAQAQANREAANTARQMAQFRPIGIRTGFGSSNFTVDDLGRVTNAGYTLSPELQTISNRLLTGAGQYDPTQIQQLLIPSLGTSVSSLFNLGQGYLAENPQEAAQQFVNQQTALLAPSRAAEFGRINARNFATGRGGLGVNTGTGGAPSNPALQAYYNSIARQDLELAARGQEAGREQARFGAGLLSSATELGRQIPSIQSGSFLPIATQLELARSIESMGQDPFRLSLELARLQSGANTPAADIYRSGMNTAAANQFRADSFSPLGSFLSGGGSGAITGLFSGFGGGGGGGIVPGSAAALARGGSEGSLTWRD